MSLNEGEFKKRMMDFRLKNKDVIIPDFVTDMLVEASKDLKTKIETRCEISWNCSVCFKEDKVTCLTANTNEKWVRWSDVLKWFGKAK